MIDPSELALLRQKRTEAIANCQFPAAKLIDLQLKRLTAQFDDSQSSQKRLTRQLEYDKVKETVRCEAAQAHADACNKIYKVDADYRERLVSMVNTHADAIAGQAESFAGDLELSALRGVPDSRYLQLEAKIVAKFGDFDTAEQMFQESNHTHDVTVLSRQTEVREIYDRLKAQLTEKHLTDIRRHEQKRILAIQEEKRQYGKVIEKLQKQLRNAAVKFGIAQNLEEEAKFFPELDDPTRDFQAPTSPSSGRSSRSSNGSRSSPQTRSPFSPRASPGGSALSPTGSPVNRRLSLS
jgi:hypothetical protein